MKAKLQKVLADAGVASRRKSEEIIKEGRVTVNGLVVPKLGTSADLEVDEVTVDGKRLRPEKLVYIKMYKPVGYVSSRSGKEGPSVLKFVKKVKERVYPVGRLDKRSEGLILLTNDGEYANELMHPRYEHEKEYIVQLDTPLKREHQPIIKKGPRIHGVKLSPMKILAVHKGGREVHIVLREGKKRQLRRLFGKFGYAVVGLKRVRIENVTLGNLKPGQWKHFKP